MTREIDAVKRRLDALRMEKLHVTGPDANLWIALGKKRIWEGGGGANIPSFEIFTSPDWRGTEGWMRFNQPVYAGGNLVRGVELHFKRGKVMSARAAHGEKFLKELVKTPNGDKVGEFSLTDKRFSKITKFMATTLYDENIGGPNGNTHIALGTRSMIVMTAIPRRLRRLTGRNSASTIRPCIRISFRRPQGLVTAYLKNGKEKVIYKDGMFALD